MADDSVLPRGNRGDRKVDRVRVRFVAHTATKGESGPNPPPLSMPF
jgi:hypothetical protein